MGVQTSRYPPVEEAAVARDDMVAGHKSETQAAAPSLQGAATEMVKLQDGDDLAGCDANAARITNEAKKNEKARRLITDSLRENAKTARAGLCAVIVFFVLLLGLFAAVTFAFFTRYTTTEESHGFEVGMDGHVLRTAPARFELPLIVAPVLPWAQLKDVSSLTVTYYDPANSDLDGQKVRASVTIVNVAHVNETAVQFDATAGHRVKAVRVWNGEALVVFDDGTTASACAADVSCSALTSTDGDLIDEQKEMAYEALHDSGFTQFYASTNVDEIAARFCAEETGRRELVHVLTTGASQGKVCRQNWCSKGTDKGQTRLPPGELRACCPLPCGLCGGSGCGSMVDKCPHFVLVSAHAASHRARDPLACSGRPLGPEKSALASWMMKTGYGGV